jgi:hypothetical protein
LLLSNGENTACQEDLSFNRVDEVLSVVPMEAANGVPTTPATVALCRMFLLENCISGRLSHHGPLQFCLMLTLAEWKMEMPLCTHFKCKWKNLLS